MKVPFQMEVVDLSVHIQPKKNIHVTLRKNEQLIYLKMKILSKGSGKLLDSNYDGKVSWKVAFIRYWEIIKVAYKNVRWKKRFAEKNGARHICCSQHEFHGRG